MNINYNCIIACTHYVSTDRVKNVIWQASETSYCICVIMVIKNYSSNYKGHVGL